MRRLWVRIPSRPPNLHGAAPQCLLPSVFVSVTFAPGIAAPEGLRIVPDTDWEARHMKAFIFRLALRNENENDCALGNNERRSAAGM